MDRTNVETNHKIITQDLVNKILIEPAFNGGNRLCIVSGYATSAMAFNHLNQLSGKKMDVKVELIIGMCSQDGLPQSDHLAFLQMVQSEFKENFLCSYFYKSPPVHSKVYVWLNDTRPMCAFAGSANYTQKAFCGLQSEAMVECDPVSALNCFNNLIGDTIYCSHPEAEAHIIIYKDYYKKRMVRHSESVEPPLTQISNYSELPKETLSFLEKNGDLPPRSGLNWGQRPEHNRDPNQAYIKIPSKVYKSDFFPKRGIHFTVLTDDKKTLICTRAQDKGKAIHTPHNNSLIGEYFRSRLGVASGQPISISDLTAYGRTDVDFYKIDDETYLMDFSPIAK